MNGSDARSGGRLPLRTLLGYGVGGFIAPIVTGNIVVLLNPFYVNILGVPATVAGFLIMVPRLWDAFWDPLVGQLSDNCRSRWGRRKPFLYAGAVGLGVSYFFFFAAPFAAHNVVGNAAWLLVFGLLVYMLSSVYLIPYSALGFELSLDYDQRTRVMSWSMVAAQVAEAARFYSLPLGLWLLASSAYAGNERYAYGLAGFVFAVAMIVAGLAAARFARERYGQSAAVGLSLWASLATTLKDRLYLRLVVLQIIFLMGLIFIATNNYYLQTYYMNDKFLAGNTALLNGILVCVWVAVWNRLTPRMGKVWVLRLGTSLMAVAALTTYWGFTPGHPWRALLLFPLAWAPGWAAYMVMSPAIVADLTDLDELRTGKRREGSYASVGGFITKLAFTVVALPTGLILDYVVKFDRDLGLNQTPDTWERLKLCNMLIPCAFTALALLAIAKFPLTKQRMLEVRAELNARTGQKGFEQETDVAGQETVS